MDLNDDGLRDLIVASTSTDAVLVYLANGRGGFNAPVRYPVSIGPTELDVIDVNGDGRPDLVILASGALQAGGNGSVQVRLNTGGGAFGAARTYEVGVNPTRLTSFLSSSGTQARLLVVNTGSNSVSYLVGAGNGIFSVAATLAVGSAPADLVTADVNGDGTSDIVVANAGDSTVSVILRETVGGAPILPAATHPVCTSPTRLARGDFNADGKTDIVFTCPGSGAIGALVGLGNGTFERAISWSLGKVPRGIVHPAVDVNGDGTPDVVVRNEDSSVSVVFLRSATDAGITHYPAGAPGSAFGLALSDLTGDDKLDIVAPNAADNKVYVYPGNGDGSFGDQLSFAAGQGPVSRFSVADIDGDGRTDLALPGAANAVTLLYQTSAPPPLGTATEFYNTTLDNYFITADPNEAAAIDRGSAGPGWQRTGASFNFKSGGNTYVCRFYGSINPGPNSHFYTARPQECEGLKLLQAQTPATQKRWNFESLDFVSTLPAGSTCPAGTVPVYRAYNNGAARGVDSNHRITVNRAGIDQVLARGWVDEGVQMCAPQ